MDPQSGVRALLAHRSAGRGGRRPGGRRPGSRDRRARHERGLPPVCGARADNRRAPPVPVCPRRAGRGQPASPGQPPSAGRPGRSVRARRVRRRHGRERADRLLAPRAIRRADERAGSSVRRHRRPPGGFLRACRTPGRPLRPHQHHGLHAPAQQPCLAPGALSPTLPIAMLMLLARFSLSQMDVPARQAYVVSIVPPADRAGAVASTGALCGVAQAFGPALTDIAIQTAPSGFRSSSAEASRRSMTWGCTRGSEGARPNTSADVAIGPRSSIRAVAAPRRRGAAPPTRSRTRGRRVSCRSPSG